MTNRKEWKILSEKQVYESKWITVRHHDVIAPTGNEGVYGAVHFKNLAIGVLPIDEDGYTYLVGQERFCFNAYSWELPEGGGERDVDPLETASRELAEEVNLKAGAYTPLFENVAFSNSVSDEIGSAYIATDLSPCPGEPDDTEVLAVKRLPVKDVFDMLGRGEITDMFTFAMMYKAHHMAHTGQLPEKICKAVLAR